MHDHINEMGMGFDSKLQGIESKFGNMVNTLASIQLQLSNMSKGKSIVEEGSILGDPLSVNMHGGTYSRSQSNTIEKWYAGKSDNSQVTQFK